MRAGTIVATNYMAMAGVLADSFLREHPSSTFVVLVVDADGSRTAELAAALPAGAEVATPDRLDLGEPVLSVMQTIYDVMEFSTALKPSFLRFLLGGQDDVVACYLDPDIEVYSAFDDQVEPALQRGIVLTPHVLQPVPRDGKRVDEGTIMQSGMYNCGFIAVSHLALPFLDWWDVRLRFDADVDFEVSHFTDQRWVDWVPSLFDHHISRDPTMNIAWWNVHERSVELDGEVPVLDGRPVRFVHFSAYDPERPDVLSRHQLTVPRVEHAQGSAMRILADRYGDQLVRRGHLERRAEPYGWSTSVDGVPLSKDVRRQVRDALLAEVGENVSSPERTVPDGFGGGCGSLSAWLAARDDDAANPTGTTSSAAYSAARAQAERFQPAARRLIARADRMLASRAHRPQPALSADRRFALLHIPKSAGSALTAAVHAALADRVWDTHTFDESMLGPFRGVPTPEPLRSRILCDPSVLAEVEAAAGHFSLATLTAGFDEADIALLVREPRARLLSHYEYWRGLPVEVHEAHLPWTDSQSAVDASFEQWLSDPSVIHQTDNVLVRFLLAGDAGIPATGEIPHDRMNRLAGAAIKRVRRIGWVGLVELGDQTWQSLSDRVGAPIRPQAINVTEVRADRPVDLDGVLSERSTTLLAARTAGDALVWREIATLVGVENPDVLADVAWNRRLRVTARNAAMA